MYSEYFLLKKSPFQLLLDTDMVYWGDGLKAVWGEITRHLGNGQSPQFIQGQAGSGKTLLLHLLALRSIELGHNCAYIDAADRKADLFESLSQAYGLDYPTRSEEQYLTWFESFLASSRLGGVQNVLLLDNMHRLDEASLQKLVYLVRIRIDNTPLLHVVAASDPQLPEHVHAVLADHKIPLQPHRLVALTEEETGAYLCHRLRCAGHADGDLFDSEVVRWIHEKSRGLPREINFYADLLLTHAFLQREPRVGESLIKRVDPSYALQGQRLRPVAEPAISSGSDEQGPPLSERDPSPEGMPFLDESGPSFPQAETAAPAAIEADIGRIEKGHDGEPVASPVAADASPSTVERTGTLPETSPDSAPVAPAKHEVRGDASLSREPLQPLSSPVQEPAIDVDKLGELPLAQETAARIEETPETGEKAKESTPPPPPTSSEPEAPRVTGDQQAGGGRRWLFIAVAALLMIAFAGAVLLSSRLPGNAPKEMTVERSSTEPTPVVREEEPPVAARTQAEGTTETVASTPSQPPADATAEAVKAPPVQKPEPERSAPVKESKPSEKTSGGENRLARKEPSPPPKTADRNERRPAPPTEKPPAGGPRDSTPPDSKVAERRDAPTRLARTTPASAQEEVASSPQQEDSTEFARFSPTQEQADHLLPLAALDSLVRRFQWAYENGDENLLAELFDQAIRTNESEGRENIIGEYRQFFSITQARRLEIGPVEWQTSGTTATGVARFTAHVVTTKGRERTFHGTLTIETRSTPQGLRITALFYRYDS